MYDTLQEKDEARAEGRGSRTGLEQDYHGPAISGVSTDGAINRCWSQHSGDVSPNEQAKHAVMDCWRISKEVA